MGGSKLRRLHDSTNPSLLDRVRDLADHGSWREFEARYRELILRYCLRRGLGPHDAEDVLQAVLLSLAKRLPTFEYSPRAGRFRAYLRRAVENEIRRERARPNRGAARVEELVLDPPDGGDVHESLWQEEWTLHHYRRAMAEVRATFPERSLAVFAALLEGVAPDALARERGLSVEAIYKIKQRIRDRLRECIESQVHEEEFRERRA
jgi:RNA polymerase sigma factor (sigma-70 family)